MSDEVADRGAVDELAFEIGASLTAGHDPNTIARHLVAAGWRRTPARRPLPLLGAIGLTAPVAGVVGAVFAGDWRWAVAGVGALIVGAVIGAATDRRG